MLISGKTDKGIVRATNQDDFAAGSLPGGAAYAVVCDGMGGANGGNIASQTAVKIINREIRANFSENLSDVEIKRLVEKAASAANAEVYKMSNEDTELSGMGTTLVVVIATPKFFITANAGDSRAYLLNEGIRQITHDHSVVQEMVENGKITSDEALTHPQKNIITRALGVEETLELDFTKNDFTFGESLLICTDGLTNMVDNETIMTTVKDSVPKESSEKLIALANENGGSDNITVVVICNDLSGGEIDG